MKKSIIKATIMLAIIILVSIMPKNSYAATSGKLDNVLVEMVDSTIVSINIIDYKLSIRNQNQMFRFLAGEKNYMKLYGINSGGKYIYLIDYKLRLRNNGKDMIDALNTASPIPEAEVLTYHVLVNNNGTYSTQPLFPGIEAFRVIDIY